MANRRRILMLVEDDGPTRRALQGFFTSRGWDVHPAISVSEGMALLTQGVEPDCLILDLMLPDGEGETVLREVRVRRMKTNVAVCTGTDDPIRLDRVLALGPNVLLKKPVELKTLSELCETGNCN